MSALEIVQIRAGEMANFSYLVFCPETRRGIGVDPSLAPQNLLGAASDRGVSIELVVNTHGHRDHTGGNAAVLKATGARLAAPPDILPAPSLCRAPGRFSPATLFS